MDVASLVLNPQCQHHDGFDQSLLEYQEISAHIQEPTFSVHHVEFNPVVIVSCQASGISFTKFHFFTV